MAESSRTTMSTSIHFGMGYDLPAKLADESANSKNCFLSFETCLPGVPEKGVGV